MVYVQPSNIADGQVISATKWNQDIRANQIAGVPDIFEAAGDIAYATAADTAARLAISIPGNILTVSGGLPAWTSPAPIQDRDVSSQQVISTVAETTVYTYTLPGGTLSTNKLIRMVVMGTYALAASQTCRVRVKWGGVTISDITIPYYSSTYYYSDALRIWIASANSASAQRSYVQHNVTIEHSQGTGTTQSPGVFAQTHNGLTVASASDQAIVVTITESSTSNVYDFYCAQMEVL